MTNGATLRPAQPDGERNGRAAETAGAASPYRARIAGAPCLDPARVEARGPSSGPQGRRRCGAAVPCLQGELRRGRGYDWRSGSDRQGCREAPQIGASFDRRARRCGVSGTPRSLDRGGREVPDSVPGERVVKEGGVAHWCHDPGALVSLTWRTGAPLPISPIYPANASRRPRKPSASTSQSGVAA